MGKNNIRNPDPINNVGGVSISGLESLDNNVINYPLFCFKYLHPDYDFERCKIANTKFLKGLVTRVKALSDSTWSQIQLSSKEGIGAEKISKKSIRVSIPGSITRDIQDFLSIRFCGKDARIIGYRNTNIFHVIYIDTKLNVYKH